VPAYEALVRREASAAGLGMRQLAAAFGLRPKLQGGSKLPQSKAPFGRVITAKLCGIRRDAGAPRNFNRWTASKARTHAVFIEPVPGRSPVATGHP